MSVYFTNSLTPATGLGLLLELPPRQAVQGHRLAHRGGAAWSLPLSNRGRNGRQDARPRFTRPSYRWSAQSLLGRGIETFLARCFLSSVPSRCSARPMGSGAEMDQLILKRAALSRSSGRWNDDDFDVLAGGE